MGGTNRDERGGSDFRRSALLLLTTLWSRQ